MGEAACIAWCETIDAINWILCEMNHTVDLPGEIKYKADAMMAKEKCIENCKPPCDQKSKY